MPSDGACSGFFELFGFIAAVAVGEVEPKEGKTSSRQKSQSSTIREFDPDEHDKKSPDCAEYIKLEARAAVRCCREAGGFIISLSGSNSLSSALPKSSPRSQRPLKAVYLAATCERLEIKIETLRRLP